MNEFTKKMPSRERAWSSSCIKVGFFQTGFHMLTASSVMILAAWIFTLTTNPAAGAYIYDWESTSGPIFTASFQVPDSAIADGVITASEIEPPGFLAKSSVGSFVKLTADSALAVDPLSGGILPSTNSFVSTNTSDTLLLSSKGFFIPSDLTQPRGFGAWKVTHLSDTLKIDLYSYVNGRARLRVLEPNTAMYGTNFVVEASTDLMRWNPVLTNVIVGVESMVLDPTPTVYRACFYRVIIRN